MAAIRKLKGVGLTSCAAVLFAVSVASLATVVDWRENPGEIFRSTEGTQWMIVWETWVSWFLPGLAVGAVAVCLWMVGRNQYQKRVCFGGQKDQHLQP